MANRRHGESHRTPEYRAWIDIISRCCNPNHRWYPRYGGRGIEICERWREDYRAFLEDVGRRPSPRHSIDRIDNNKSYYKENCAWRTPEEQLNNKSDNHWLEINGERRTISQWAKHVGRISPNGIRNRLNSGWTVSDAVTTPSAFKPERWVEIDGERKTLSQWAAEFGMPAHIIRGRLKIGWAAKDAVTTPIFKKGGPKKRKEI